MPPPKKDAGDEIRLDGEGNPIDDQPLVQRAVDQWPLALVLIGVAVGLLILAFADFKQGSLILGCSVIFAGALRTVLTQERAGLLAIRSRSIDLITVYSLGIALTTLALVVPPPR
ncbi:MAG TPA: DUF3017 domain-containing protein [Actinomycetes bacterium]|nr:DUF3017 domain-containing protein [Actinomycetes bacterium]